MAYLRINGRTISYDPNLEYLTIGTVCSNHGGTVEDVFFLNPKSHLGCGGRPDFLEGLKYELEQDLRLVQQFLQTGTFYGGNGVRRLAEEDRPAFERTIELYHQIISALEEK